MLRHISPVDSTINTWEETSLPKPRGPWCACLQVVVAQGERVYVTKVSNGWRKVEATVEELGVSRLELAGLLEQVKS